MSKKQKLINLANVSAPASKTVNMTNGNVAVVTQVQEPVVSEKAQTNVNGINVPHYIRKSADKMALHSSYVRENEEKIRSWMERNELHNKYNVDRLIENCVDSDNPEVFIKFLESDGGCKIGNTIK